MGYIEIIAPEGSKKPLFASILQKNMADIFLTTDQAHKKFVDSLRITKYSIRRSLSEILHRAGRAEDLKRLESSLNDRKILSYWRNKESLLALREAIFSEVPTNPGPTLWKYNEILERAATHNILAEHNCKPIVYPRGVLHAVATTATHCGHTKTWVSDVVSTLPFQVHSIIKLEVLMANNVSRDFRHEQKRSMDYIKKELYTSPFEYIERLALNQKNITDFYVNHGVPTFNVPWDPEKELTLNKDAHDSLETIRNFFRSSTGSTQ